MKKLLFVALAAIGMVACVQNEQLAVNKSTAIAFKQHVNNVSSRVNDPSFTKDNLENFRVWGWMTTNEGTVFTGDVVSGSSASGWSYDNTQYWAPNRFYSFEAVAPANGGWAAVEETAADIKGLTFTNANGTEDLLYATYSVTTPDMATLVSGYDPVPLQFAHLLAKVQFSFKNSFTSDNYTINVTNVTMSVPKAGSLDLDSKAWTINAAEGNFDLAFGNAEATLMPNATTYTTVENALLTIPTDASAIYNISFNIEILSGAEIALNETVTTTISDKALVMGKAYNFKAVIGPEVFGLQPIEFTVEEVNDWINEDYEVALPTHVKNAEELAAALNAGKGNIVLTDNVDYGTVTLEELNNATIQGGNNTTMRFVTTATSKLVNVTLKDIDFSFVTGAGQKNGAFVVIDSAAQIDNLVIEGCTIVGDGKKNSYGIYGQNPNATIVVKACEFSNLGYAIQTISAGGYKSLVVEACTFEGILSWVILPQYGYTGDLTINGCTFNNTTGGLIKTGTFSGSTLTFTNNTITNSVGHDGKDSKWFEVDASAATKVISGNTKDGAEWIPSAAEGLK